VSSARLPYLTAKLQGFGTTIFAEMSALAMSTGSVNLGQGFPDTAGPREVLDAAIAAINAGINQYPPGPGMAVLREARARPLPPDVIMMTAYAVEDQLRRAIDAQAFAVIHKPFQIAYLLGLVKGAAGIAS